MRAFDPENQASYLGGVSEAREIEPGALALPAVKAAVAFASLKGGTGKSALAVSLAAALAQAGKRVAILDADLAAPSTLATARSTSRERRKAVSTQVSGTSSPCSDSGCSASTAVRSCSTGR